MAEAITYERRRPEATTLYEVVRDNLETLYGAVEDGAVKLRPRFVRKEVEVVRQRAEAAARAVARSAPAARRP